MSSYQGNDGSYTGGAAAGGPTPGYQGPPSDPSPTQHDLPPQQQAWEGQQTHQGGSGYQGAGHQGGGFPGGGFPGGNPLASRVGRSVDVRPTFKTTEFWIWLLVSIALLIAAAVTDRGADGQGFGAQDAWKYVTWLSIAYILSRGLTKLGGHERGNDHH
jgi:hypothetical protein